MTISVKNPTRRPKTFMVIGGKTVKTKMLVSEKKASGEMGLRHKEIQTPESITVGPGQVRTGLPNECAAEARACGLEVFQMAGE